VMISSYVFREAAEFFHRLAEKSDNIPGFRVIFLLDLSHRRKNPMDPAPIIGSAFAAEFLRKHWPGQRVPELWHDPRGFAADDATAGVMHAKTVIIDRKTVFITSRVKAEISKSALSSVTQGQQSAFMDIFPV
jgi:hypothetical protein